MPQHITQRERVVARTVLLVVLLAAGVTLWMSEAHRQPYPGLSMPRFANAGPPDEEFRTLEGDIVVAFADGRTTTLTAEQLVGRSYLASRIVRNNFGDDLDGTGALKRPIGSDWSVLLEGWNRGRPPRTSVARAHDPRTRAWLRERLATLYPDATPTAVTFTWTRVVRAIPEGTLIDQKPEAFVEVEL